MDAKGFTLVEVVIAVAIGSLLAGGVYAAVVSATGVSERQKAAAAGESARTRALAILREDFRGRLGLKVETRPGRAGPQGEVAFTLSTTADAIGAEETRRGLKEVRYVASSQGLKRAEVRPEGPVEIALLEEPVAIEFWNNGLWGPTSATEPSLMKVAFPKAGASSVVR